MNSAIFLGVTVLLVVFDLITVAARTGLRNASLVRILQMREQLETQVHRARDLMQNLSRPYAGLHLAQSFIRVLWIGFIFLSIRQGQPDSLIIQFLLLILAGLVIAWLEWLVERMVTHNPEITVLRLALYIQIIEILFSPIIIVSLLISKDIFAPPDELGMVTDDALKTLVDTGQQEGVFEKEERKMIFSIIQLGDTLTREIMVPRIDVLALDVNTALQDAVDALLGSGYSRVPVYEDTIDNVLGMLYGKDLLKIWHEKNGYLESLRAVLREPYFVPEAKKVDELLAEMQSLRVHMAIVVDEYGGVAGVVTLEDIIEEIFGEIQDEYDEEEQPYQMLANGDYVFRGRIDLDDFNDIMKVSLPADDADTLGGFLYTRLGHVPTPGESVSENGVRLTVEQVSSRRIRKVRAQKDEKNETSKVD